MESGWVLEKIEGGHGPNALGATTLYLTAKDGYWGWSQNHLDAFRLARREDGDALADIIDDATYVREHQWG